MKQWYVGVNDYHHFAYVSLETIPNFYHYLDYVITRICDIFTFRGWFHQYIHIPIFNWCESKRKVIQVIHLPYYTAKRMFPSNFEDTNDFLSLEGTITDDDVLKFFEKRKKLELMDEEFTKIYKKVEEYNNGKYVEYI